MDAPSGASAARIPSCLLTTPRLPRANVQTLTAAALNRTCLEAFVITSSFAGTAVSKGADRVSDYRAGETYRLAAGASRSYARTAAHARARIPREIREYRGRLPE